MVDFTYEYNITKLEIEDKEKIWVSFPIARVEIFIDSETEQIEHVFKCDAVIRPNKDFKHEIRNMNERNFYINRAWELLENKSNITE